ncbi:glycosyltransferase family 4 protein [Tumidithrix elongata RA019]|uniref:Glycosyltransferase family 4 protein n=1 Tax=Tumidithrix elongata BACA0141 TaxID=2716417 RepID=A0AAW9PRT5_9CYAN|nr:glycosyltransferase family 4 protein [Tumidithrix elongata RA019]
MKPRILHVLIDRNLGGVTASVNSLLRSTLAEKFDFLLLTPQEALSQLSQPQSELKTQVKPELIVAHDACSWKFIFTLVQLRLRSRLCIQEHHYSEAFEAINVPSKWRFRLMLKLAYGIANRVITISYAQMDWMLKYKLVKPRKLTVIQQCRILEDFLAIPTKPLGGRLVLGVYGRFSAQKGIDLLLKAMQDLRDLDVELLIGGYGEDEATLRQLAEGDRRIQFVGKLANVPEFLETCDVVVIPSRWEPWGNVLLEAKAAGKPVIVTSVDGLTEQFEDCGLLVGANVEEIKSAIAKVANIHKTSPQTLIDWGDNGRQAVRGAWERYLAEWEQLLGQLSRKP